MKKIITIALLALCLASSAVFAGGSVAAGKEKSQTCVACHGEAGISPTAQFPNIAGQYRDYLYQALTDYKSGNRKNPIMGGIVAALNEQDMKDLAAYYASLEGLEALSLP